MKIPTLIGVALIIALIVTGVLFYMRRQTPVPSDITVTDLKVVNISDTSATVVWQTSKPVSSLLFYGENPSPNTEAADNRDRIEPQNRITHFVTLNNLKPKTKYFFKTSNGGSFFPETPQEFMTADVLPHTEEITFSFIKPIKGTVLNINLNPVDESLIFLNIPGAQELAAFSSTAGNFVVSLKTVLNEDLSQVFTIAQDTTADLIITKGGLQSRIKINISDSTVNLPPISLGNNLDLTNYVASPITTISIGQNNTVKLDFNNDNKINSLDLAILRTKSSSKTLPSAEDLAKFDITRDGIIDQNDVDSFSKSLTGRP